MTGHLLVPSLDAAVATVSRPITTGLLRDELGFAGTIVTDALEMAAVSATIGIAEGFVQALIAGADAIETGAQDAARLIEPIVAAVTHAVHDGRLSVDRLQDAARRTAELATPGEPGAPVSLNEVAARCLEVRDPVLAERSVHSGPLGQKRLDRPLVVECRSPNGVATGELPWSLAAVLAERLSGVEPMPVDGPVGVDAILARARGRSLVAVVRDPHRHPWQRSVLDAAMLHPDSVIVDAGWPAEDLPGEIPLVRTRGVAPGLFAAAADVLTGARV